jgi:hypothetical protein
LGLDISPLAAEGMLSLRDGAPGAGDGTRGVGDGVGRLWVHPQNKSPPSSRGVSLRIILLLILLLPLWLANGVARHTRARHLPYSRGPAANLLRRLAQRYVCETDPDASHATLSRLSWRVTTKRQHPPHTIWEDCRRLTKTTRYASVARSCGRSILIESILHLRLRVKFRCGGVEKVQRCLPLPQGVVGVSTCGTKCGMPFN